MTKALLICSFVILGPLSARAATPPPAASARQYPGGADEQDLKVQPQLTPPTAKTNRTMMDQKVLQSFLRKTGQPAASATTKAKPKQ